MQSLFHVRKSVSSLALNVCRRCYVTRVKGQQGIHPVNRGFARPTVFFVHVPPTQDARDVVRSMQGRVSADTVKAVFQEAKDTNKLHWSIFSTYVPCLLSFRLVDDALQVMREAIMQSMIHPHLYNLFLDILFKHKDYDTAINFIKEVGYTPFQPSVDKWMTLLTISGDKDLIAKAIDLASFLAKETSLSLLDAYSVPYAKVLGTHQPSEWCFSILNEFQKVEEPLPESFTLPLLHLNLIANPNRENVLKLVNLTSPQIFIRAIYWYKTRSDMHLLPQLYKFIHEEFPEIQQEFLRTAEYRHFIPSWQRFVSLLDPKLDHETKELRLEEVDSVLLSALAIVPEFGERLLDRMVQQNVTVDPIYYEYKRMRDLPYPKSPFNHLFSEHSTRDAYATTHTVNGYHPTIAPHHVAHVNGYHSAPHHVGVNGYGKHHHTESEETTSELQFLEAESVFVNYYSVAMSKHGVRPSRAMNDAVITAFLRERKEERAKEVVEWMESEGLDISGFNSIFADYYICTNRPEIAAKIMLEAKDGVQPTLEELNKVIDIMGEHGYIAQAAKLCRDMKSILGIRPTLATQSLMMKNTVKHQGLEDGLILLDKIRDKWRLNPDKKIYRVLLEAAIADKRSDKVEELRNLFRADKIHLDMTFYNLLLEGYLKLGDEAEALNLLRRFASTGYSPNGETYRILLRNYAAAKNIGQLISLLREIAKNSELVDELLDDFIVTFTMLDKAEKLDILVRVLLKLNKTEQAERVRDILLYNIYYKQNKELAIRAMLGLKELDFLPPSQDTVIILNMLSRLGVDCSSFAVQLGVGRFPSVILSATPSVLSVSPSPSPFHVSLPSTAAVVPPSMPLSPDQPSPVFLSSPSILSTYSQPSLVAAPIVFSTPPIQPTLYSQPILSTPISSPPPPPTPAPSPLPSRVSTLSSNSSPFPRSSPSLSQQLPPTVRNVSPLSPTSSLLSPSSPPSYSLSRSVAYQFVDEFAHLRVRAKENSGVLDKFQEYEEHEEEIEDNNSKSNNEIREEETVRESFLSGMRLWSR